MDQEFDTFYAKELEEQRWFEIQKATAYRLLHELRERGVFYPWQGKREEQKLEKTYGKE